MEDTSDFLRFLDKLNNEHIPEDVVPISIDVVALYSSIPQEDAVNAVKTTLDNRNSEQKDNMPTSFLVNLLQMILQFNTFEFDE